MREKLNQLNLFSLYKIKFLDKLFYNIQDAALFLGNVSINKSYVIQNDPNKINEIKGQVTLFKNGNFFRDTIFNEIISVPFEQYSDNINKLLLKKPKREKIEIKILAKLYLENVKDFIKNNLNREKHYIMPHSAGYDSRIISKILFDLKKENINSFKSIKFVSWQPEIFETEKIIRFIGFSDDTILKIRPEHDEIDYLDDLFSDINFLGKRISEGNKMLFQMFRAEEIIKLAIPKNEVVMLSALFADEIMKFNIRNWESLSTFFILYFSIIPYNWAPVDYVLYPNLCEKNLELLTDYEVPRNTPFKLNSIDDFKIEILNILDEDLAKINNPRFGLSKFRKENGYAKYHQISNNLREIIETNIRSSWYYKNYKNHIDKYLPVMNYINPVTDLYKEYAKIAICEYLINSGCKITK